MKYKAIIVDDEKNAIRTLSILLEELCPNIDIIATASTVDEAVQQIEELNPDLVFLDIEMPTGSGFEVVDRTSYLQYKLIFTTAYNEYAVKAFKVNAIDYLLKPINETELLAAVKKVTELRQTKIDLNNIASLFRKNETIKINIPTSEGFSLIDINHILRVESDSNYSLFYFQNKTKLMVSKTLKDIEQQLEKHGFIRVHNSHIINKKYVEKYIKSDGGYLVLSDGTMVPLSKRRKQAILAMFD